MTEILEAARSLATPELAAMKNTDQSTEPSADESALLAPVYPLPRLEIASAHGCWVTDVRGEKHLDFTSGIAVNALGHTPPGLATAIARQLRQLGHVSNLFGNAPALALARELCAATGYARVFFCNSGTEGVEAALKFARALARARGLEGRDVVAFHGGFHGRTAFALAATHTPSYREPFEPLVPGVRFAPFNDLGALDAAFEPGVCAAIVEPVQGEGGAIPATREFLEAVAARCQARGAALIFDEVQSGMGRCGHVLAADHYGVRADFTVLSKALGGGLPLGVVLMTADAAAALAPGMHGCTFGGGPAATTAGAFVLRAVNRPTFLARVRARGRDLARALAELVARHPSLSATHGLGLLQAIEVAPTASYDPPALVRAARSEKLLLVRGGERGVRLLPPLTVTRVEIREAVARLDRAVTALEQRSTEETQ